MNKVLVTGGTGYIGSHTVIELLNDNQDVVIVDNLSNSKIGVVDRIEQITGKRPAFYNVDVRDKAKLLKIFKDEKPTDVIHFAGLKAVGESVKIPLAYYDNNLNSTLVLIDCMRECGVKNLVFSSSATVYGCPKSVPIFEDFPLSATNPYGQTKLMIEQILKDFYHSDNSFNIALLRYFNPIGAHESGLIGEKPNGIPNNLMPYITQVAAGILPQLSVFGDDYPTSDGTGVRDYIHVVDLAKGHVAALRYAMRHTGAEAVNLGTGRGYSVLDIVRAFEEANGVKIPYRIAPRRAGDLAVCYAETEKAKRLLGWQAEKGLVDMCRDSWRWQQNCTGRMKQL